MVQRKCQASTLNFLCLTYFSSSQSSWVCLLKLLRHSQRQNKPDALCCARSSRTSKVLTWQRAGQQHRAEQGPFIFLTDGEHLWVLFSPLHDSSCRAPAFVCMLHSLLCQRACVLLLDDLLFAFDRGWGHFTLFYYLMCVHRAYFNCCIHTPILQINAVPLPVSEEPPEIIDLLIFLFLVIMSSAAQSSSPWHRLCSHYACFHGQYRDNC